MWICLNNAFLSIVHKHCGTDELLVRARREGDIERVFPGAKATESHDSDYRYRARIKRGTVATAMAQAIIDINYPNFKDSVKEPDMHRAYLDVWQIMEQLQPVDW